jgi:hypothetical protein
MTNVKPEAPHSTCSRTGAQALLEFVVAAWAVGVSVYFYASRGFLSLARDLLREALW